MKTTKNVTACRRMEAVALLGEGKTPDEVADIKKYNSQYVRNLGLIYHREGLEVLGSDGRRGGNNRLMNKEEETEFLSQFEAEASTGKMLTIEEIAKALDEKNRQRTQIFIYRIFYFASPRMAQGDAAQQASE
jgi:transposase